MYFSRAWRKPWALLRRKGLHSLILMPCANGYMLEEDRGDEQSDSSIVQCGGVDKCSISGQNWIEFCLRSFRNYFQVCLNSWCSLIWFLTLLPNGIISVQKRNTKPSLFTFPDAFQIPQNSVKPSERQRGSKLNIHLHFFGKEFLR